MVVKEAEGTSQATTFLGVLTSQGGDNQWFWASLSQLF
jgi:hypothetical protein